MNISATIKNAFDAMDISTKITLVKKYGPRTARGLGALVAVTPGWVLAGGAAATGVVLYKRWKQAR